MNHDLSLAPETWATAARVARKVAQPIERFLRVEAASGILLLLATILAISWANSPWSGHYEALWHTPVVLGVGHFVSSQSLHFWINDGIMTVFFLVVGLEIRREIQEGELSDVRRAALPIAAALGGMIAPALLYLLLSVDSTRAGWGVPMATDIAFAVGVITLLGKRVPPALRVLLLALAIADDIGAIAVIAVAYSGGLNLLGLAIAMLGLLLVVALQRLGVRRALAYVPAGAVLWLGTLKAGIHPTLAGVVLGLMTPAQAWYGKQGFVKVAHEVADEIDRHDDGGHGVGESISRMRTAQREMLSPVVRLQMALHQWVAFVAMPLFALANAGVDLRGVAFNSANATSAATGVFLGLVVGKPIGVLVGSALAVRFGWAVLPRGVKWSGIAVVGSLAGIGFTMAIFIAGLAFTDPMLLGAAKLGVLVASLVAAVLGLVAGRFAFPNTWLPGTAATEQEAERSTEA